MADAGILAISNFQITLPNGSKERAQNQWVEIQSGLHLWDLFSHHKQLSSRVNK